jgi:hypothetical protein
MMTLNLFPVRVPIGSATLPDGRTVDVLISREFAKAMAGLLVRIGGSDGMGTDDIAALASTEVPAAQLLALMGKVEELRAQVELVAPAVSLYRQIEAMRAELAQIEDPAAQVRYILTRYAPLLSPTFTGVPKAPTAAQDTNTTQIATTEFYAKQASLVAPQPDGAAVPGTSLRFARADHVHPTDTTRQAAISPATVTGSRGGNVALASLLTGMATQGLIINNTTA